MRSVSVVFFAILLATMPLGAAADEPTSSDADLIQGRWRPLSVTNNGEKTAAEELQGSLITFTGENFIGTGKRTLRGTFALVSTTEPKQIDLRVQGENDATVVMKGIFRLRGDTLTICSPANPGAERPDDFTSTPGDRRTLFILNRVPDKESIQGTWKVVALEAGGQQAPGSLKLRFLIKDDRFSSTGDAEDLRPYKLDATARPAAIDIPVGEGQFSKGIYEIDGDSLKLCFSQSTKLERPKSFDTTGTRYVCFTLKRETP